MVYKFVFANMRKTSKSVKAKKLNKNSNPVEKKEKIQQWERKNNKVSKIPKTD